MIFEKLYLFQKDDAVKVPRSSLAGVALVGLLSSVAACSPVTTTTTLSTPLTNQVQTAGPGDVVMEFQSRRSLPNAFGYASPIGRSTNAGRTTVRYMGTRGQQAIFVRSDLVIDSNATTMSETPIILPSHTTTTVTGMVGTAPIHGSASSTSFSVIPARGSSEVATMMQPIEIDLGAGQSVSIQGHKLQVISVGPVSVDYRIE